MSARPWGGRLAVLCLLVPAPAFASFHLSKDDPDRSGCVVCHPPSGQGQRAITTQLVGRQEACLGCHDGGLAGDTLASVPVTRRSWREDADIDLAPANPGDHPVGMRYREGPDLHAIVDVLDSGVKLYDDGDGYVVACTSCHDPHLNGRPAMLRGPSGNLCVTCHAMF